MLHNFVSLGQVRAGYVRSGQVTSGCLDISG